MGRYSLPPPIKLSDSGPPPNANFYPDGKRKSFQGHGSPENRVMANIGDDYTDLDEGNEWKKISNDGLASGWEQESVSLADIIDFNVVPSGGVTSGAPEGVISAGPGSFRWDPVARTLWLKDTGTGNTGWIELLTL